MKNNSEDERKYIEHLNRNINNPQVIEALIGRYNSFEIQVEHCYDICVLDSRTPRDYILRNPSPEDTRKRPEDLIEILNPFGEIDLDTSKLGYNYVRTSYGKWYKGLREFLSIIDLEIPDKNLEEFWKLYNNAQKVDKFVEYTYRPYFIEEALKNEK